LVHARFTPFSSCAGAHNRCHAEFNEKKFPTRFWGRKFQAGNDVFRHSLYVRHVAAGAQRCCAVINSSSVGTTSGQPGSPASKLATCNLHWEPDQKQPKGATASTGHSPGPVRSVTENFHSSVRLRECPLI
jgi:hypothetical protein